MGAEDAGDGPEAPAAGRALLLIFGGEHELAVRGRKDPCPSRQQRRGRAETEASQAQIPEDAWTTIRYPRAVFDEQLGQWVSDAEVAEVPFTAFTSRAKAQRVSARLIVRRVRDANPDHVHVNDLSI